MTSAVYEDILNHLATRPFLGERGGVLLGPDDCQDLVTRYVPDETGNGSYATFTIGHYALNAAIRHVRPAGMTCVGLAHSHPDGICYPSGGDLSFLRRLFSHPRNRSGPGFFLFPIVANGRLHPFMVDTHDVRRIVTAELIII